jgi:hypothetical protein
VNILSLHFASLSAVIITKIRFWTHLHVSHLSYDYQELCRTKRERYIQVLSELARNLAIFGCREYEYEAVYRGSAVVKLLWDATAQVNELEKIEGVYDRTG